MSIGLGYGLDFVGFALIAAGVMSFGSYWFSDKLILAISGAKPANRNDHFDFYTVAENLAQSQRLPQPKLYVIEDTAMNAFATGRDPKHAVICVTTGLLGRLNRAEIEGVIAHELAHVQNYDIRLMSLVSILVGFIALFGDWVLRMSFWGGNKNDDNRNGGQLATIMMVLGLVMAILSPIVANLIKLAISRRREYLADASAVSMTKNPEGLARALESIGADKEPLEAANKATAHLYFSNPLAKSKGAVHWFAGLFNTHPPIEDRINVLRNMAK
jgi:heat shock protein HtpX